MTASTPPRTHPQLDARVCHLQRLGWQPGDNSSDSDIGRTDDGVWCGTCGPSFPSFLPSMLPPLTDLPSDRPTPLLCPSPIESSAKGGTKYPSEDLITNELSNAHSLRSIALRGGSGKTLRVGFTGPKCEAYALFRTEGNRQGEARPNCCIA